MWIYVYWNGIHCNASIATDFIWLFRNDGMRGAFELLRLRKLVFLAKCVNERLRRQFFPRRHDCGVVGAFCGDCCVVRNVIAPFEIYYDWIQCEVASTFFSSYPSSSFCSYTTKCWAPKVTLGQILLFAESQLHLHHHYWISKWKPFKIDLARFRSIARGIEYPHAMRIRSMIAIEWLVWSSTDEKANKMKFLTWCAIGAPIISRSHNESVYTVCISVNLRHTQNIIKFSNGIKKVKNLAVFTLSIEYNNCTESRGVWIVEVQSTRMKGQTTRDNFSKYTYIYVGQWW